MHVDEPIARMRCLINKFYFKIFEVLSPRFLKNVGTMYKRGKRIYQIKEKNEKQKVSSKHAQNKAQDYFKEFLNDLT